MRPSFVVLEMALIKVAGYFFLSPSKANRHQQSHWPLRIGFDNVAVLAPSRVCARLVANYLHGACDVIEKCLYRQHLAISARLSGIWLND